MPFDKPGDGTILGGVKTQFVPFFVAAMAGILLCGVATVQAATDPQSIYDIPLKDIDGQATTLEKYKGKVILIVNVASKCGYTRQYTPLEALYRKYKDQGLVVLGVPSNDFGGQEPGSNQEIKEFCSNKFDVSFPMLDKVGVKPGPQQHPLYAALTGPTSPVPGPVGWNFGKFLVGKDGKILARFESKDEPDSAKVTSAIEAALKQK